jgi:hypothetical protein
VEHITTIPNVIHTVHSNLCIKPGGPSLQFQLLYITNVRMASWLCIKLGILQYCRVLYSTVHLPLTSARCSDGFGVPPVWTSVYNTILQYNKFLQSNNNLLFLACTWVTNVQYNTIYHVISHKYHMLLMHMVVPTSGRIAGMM